MSHEGMNALRARVYGDAAVARRLRGIDPELFVSEVMRVAAESGADVSEAEVLAAVAHGRQEWSLRWIL
jgi:hypothetical protein